MYHSAYEGGDDHDARGTRRPSSSRSTAAGDLQVRADPPGFGSGPPRRGARIRQRSVRQQSVVRARGLRLTGCEHRAQRDRRHRLRPLKFADTSWWAAWSLPRDSRHLEALEMFALVGDHEQVLTTNLVVGETWTLLRRRDSHRTAVSYIDRVGVLASAAKLVVHAVTAEDESRAWGWLRRHDERRYSFVDATSFQVMRARRLREALAFDNDFAAAGFVEMRP
ncbi:MAG: PIN domain-containing protein [Acidimicrobiaceae bacterium]|nr:PIN domain-containing protein [Acidimicrobiaceae bacterium]MXZ63943.1 PIN domain-containing protein [Acidimicrobiaceae bacterium]MYF33460.1 PIN domain-containing protein [Acidimicrobiaceae bacterium]MYG79185.1 PIN domain-containing protein [Acidimicrobiaceae bacterium]MYJ28707.1 PIN domain-containing protein [Acidimicrobiaceae bacterium]